MCIFVDDLDRCSGDTIMETLEAIILLLADAPVLCWLAIDSRLVEASIEERNKNVMEAAGVSGYNYMEMIIQLPFCIPDLDNQNKRNFLSRLFFHGQLDDPLYLLKVLKHDHLEDVATKEVHDSSTNDMDKKKAI